MIEAHPVRKVYAGSEFSNLASTLPGRGAFLCRCRDKRCRWRHAVHADVSIGARRVNCSSSDEKRTRTPDGVPMAAWTRDTLSYLYYQPPQNPPPTSFPDAHRRQRGVVSKLKVVTACPPPLVPHQPPKWPFPSFLPFRLSFFLHHGNLQHPHHLRSSLHRHHPLCIVRVKLILHHRSLITS